MPRNLPLRIRLFLAFGAVLALTLAVALNGAVLARTLFSNGDFYDWNIVPAYEAMHQVIKAAGQWEREQGAHSALAEQMNQGLAAYAKLIADNEDKKNFDVVKSAAEKLITTTAASPGEQQDAYSRFVQASDRWWNYNQKLSKSYAADSRKAYDEGLATSVAVLLLAVLASIGVCTWLVRSLMRELGGEPAYAAEVANSIGAGKLGIRVQLKAGDDRSVLYAMDKMRSELLTIVLAVRESSDAIAAASSEIAVGSNDLSQRTEAQASNVEETASSMEQLAAGVKTSADNSRQANELSQTASLTANQGREVMEQVVSCMANITGSSARITDIVSVIDGIAFQTNILALNAAVEAARAGEQGRGFAVVAGEVRSLAQRSATAAKEVKSLIASSSAEIDKGSELVSAAGETMNVIVSNVKKVTDLLADISTVASEQSAGLQQVGAAVNQLDSMTQQNAALVEESTAAAESLKTEAERLSRVIGVFQAG